MASIDSSSPPPEHEPSHALPSPRESLPDPDHRTSSDVVSSSTTTEETLHGTRGVMPGSYPSSSSLPIEPTQSLPSPIPSPTVPPSAVVPLHVHRSPTAAPPMPDPAPPLQRRTPTSRIRRLLAFFGFGNNNKARKQLIHIIWTTFINTGELIAIIVLLSLSTHLASPTIPSLNEWQACEKPLGAWNAIWTVRLVAHTFLAYYHWSKQRKKREGSSSGDPESSNPRTNSAEQTSNTINIVADDTNDGAQPDQEAQSGRRPRSYPAWYGRLSAFNVMFSTVWFVLAHIFLYTSTSSCRFSSPHIWWLTFSILAVIYLAVAELVLICVIVFIIGPLIALIFTIILLIMGRHPIQNPNYMKPEIEKIPRSLVDKIPLVVYIPPPPDEPSTGPVTVPPAALSYPPKPKAPPAKKPRFRFLRLKKKFKDDGSGEISDKPSSKKNSGDNAHPRTWEENWEKGEYPFVRLEDNRASCAICLLDFEEPRRADAPAGKHENDDEGHVVAMPGGLPADVLPADIRLEDAGEGAQPLRLLSCGHVFHQTCLDPWLTGVSGRCPTCQRRVELPAEVVGPKGRFWRRGDSARTS